MLEGVCFADLKDEIIKVSDPFVSILPKPVSVIKEEPKKVVPQKDIRHEERIRETKKEVVDVKQKEIVKKPVLPKIILSGTVLSPTKSYAIVNEKLVQLGEMVDGVRVVEIRKREIAVLFSGETFLIKIDTE